MVYLHLYSLRFRISLPELSGFCLMLIGGIYSPDSCSLFVMTPFAEFQNLRLTHLVWEIEEYENVFLVDSLKNIRRDAV